MLAKHTPGPWRMTGPPVSAKHDQQGDRLIEPVGREEHICETFQYRNDDAQDIETAMANARLVVKSPELLELAKGVLAGDSPRYLLRIAGELVAEIEATT